ncbi:tyrosine-type recombinase/integrase [Shouchella shacheensis]|uniref:tyrosine-type recombinase/integrase n=1 Tax=Shouchella shacheensis TaxID=1649580 RepID=UPI00074043B3|nr:site-specific integrase [Shouchella shacheensis]
MFLTEILDEYLTHLYQVGRQPSTIKRYRYDILDFCNWLADEKKEASLSVFSNMDQADIEAFFYYLMEERVYKVRTIRRIASALRRFASFMLERGMLTRHPLLIYKPPMLDVLPLAENEWATDKESHKLLAMAASEQGLSENQLRARPHLTTRNTWIFTLLLSYGLALKEIVELTMDGVNFAQRTVAIHGSDGRQRTLALIEEDQRKAYEYWAMIPEAVRPRLHTKDPFLIAFDFTRRTYHWSYEDEAPKQLTEIALQKMIRTEVERTGLRKGISAQHFRNRFILKRLLQGSKSASVQQEAGLSSSLSMNRYLLTLNELTNQQREALSSTKC